MGRILTQNNKVKFEVNSKEDCILYLGHLIEYFQKKMDIYVNLIEYNIQLFIKELEKNGINTDYVNGTLEFINEFVIKNESINFNVDFYMFKLINSSINLLKNEIANVIGDFSRDKISVSYNNYLDIICSKNILGVTYKHSSEKKNLIEKFNTYRNFTYHFTSDKLCEWINYRNEQINKFENTKFEFGKEFNIYIATNIEYKLFADEFIKNFKFYRDALKVADFMKKDFEILIGEEVNINLIKKDKLDHSVIDITYNGFESHKLSKDRINK